MSKTESTAEPRARAATTPAMTPERMVECLAVLQPFQWTRRGLARQLGYGSGTSLRDKLAGRVRITEEEAAWIEKWTAFAKQNPPPGNAQSRQAARQPEQEGQTAA